jgi:choline dehydrogenase-like flavoprotein
MWQKRIDPLHDALVIGSGPAGSIVARELTRAGARVLLLEAGREVPLQEFAGHKWPYQFPFRGQWHERQAPFYPDGIDRHIRYEGDPVGADRIRVLGGRSLHWNGVALRFSENDFREGSIHGLEPDWPLTYQELAPFYGEVERLIGVVGTHEGLAVLPDGEFYAPPPALRCAEQLGRRACHRIGIPMIPIRKALLVGQPRGQRMPCHYCRHCMDGCEVGAIATSVNSVLPDAFATGRLTLRTNALVRRIEVDREGRASGVAFVDRVTGRDHVVRGRLVVLACGAIESPRLLLNSTGPRSPNGLGNSSDLVGRYLTGHTQLGMHGYLEALEGRESVNQDGATDHSLIPRFNHLRPSRNYVGGFFAQVMYETHDYPHHATRVAGFGAPFKARVRALQPAMFQMGGMAKVLARHENRVAVDRAQVDAHGIPVPVVQFTYGENDRAIWQDMSSALEEIFHVAGSTLFFKESTMNGFASHETGTCRMGTDPKTSVLNAFSQSHDVPNLFVVDGSGFTTFPEKNPTLTIMALAMRAGRQIAELRKRGDL